MQLIKLDTEMGIGHEVTLVSTHVAIFKKNQKPTTCLSEQPEYVLPEPEIAKKIYRPPGAGVSKFITRKSAEVHSIRDPGRPKRPADKPTLTEHMHILGTNDGTLPKP
ncbi:hypothetical protein TNCV_5032811 [Trichonephila clavipes]|nr:hypothetical protein TNCV_5032811 [Trichonephila clavipes]